MVIQFVLIANLIYLEEKFQHMQIWADGTRITQIISNIISNAVKFTHKGLILLLRPPSFSLLSAY